MAIYCRPHWVIEQVRKHLVTDPDYVLELVSNLVKGHPVGWENTDWASPVA